MNQNLEKMIEPILNQDCTNFIKLQQLESIMKQTCDNFVKYLYQTDVIAFTYYSDSVYQKIDFEKQFNRFLNSK